MALEDTSFLSADIDSDYPILSAVQSKIDISNFSVDCQNFYSPIWFQFYNSSFYFNDSAFE